MSTSDPGLDAADGEAPTAAPTSGTPWRDIVQWALVGTLLLLVLVMVDVSRHGGGNPVSLIQPGTDGPSAALIAQDFPDIEAPAGVGLDGQQYYAIARHPADPEAAAEHLDWPRYRLQRPLLPWTARLLHPGGGGGVGLVWALFAAGLIGVVIGALATGALSTWWGGPPWLAALFPLLPGAWWSLRVTVSDAMALALAMAALALAARHRHAPAVAVAVLAVLAKEPTVLVFAGWALHRRTRRDALLLVVPGLVAAAWMAFLAGQLPPDPDRAQDLGLPFVGLVQAFTDVWSEGRELVGMAATLGGLALGGTALALRRLRHPLGWALAVQLAFMLVMGVNPTSVNFGATRTAMPAMLLALVALATPRAAEAQQAADGIAS